MTQQGVSDLCNDHFLETESKGLSLQHAGGGTGFSTQTLPAFKENELQGCPHLLFVYCIWNVINLLQLEVQFQNLQFNIL